MMFKSMLLLILISLSGCACGPGHINPMTHTNAHWPMCGWE